MSLVDLQIAIRSLGRHTKRTVFLGVAIACVSVLFLLLLALTEGIQENIFRSSTTLMTGHVNVGGFYKVAAGASAPLVTDFEKVLEAVRRSVPELDSAVARGRGNAKVVSGTSSMMLVLGGVDLARDERFKRVIDLAEGDLDELARPDSILLFQTVAKRLGVKAGDLLTLSAPTYRGMANTLDVHVAAIAKDMGTLSYFNAYIPFETWRSLYRLKPGSTGALFLYLRDHRAAPRVAARLRDALAAQGWSVMDADARPYWEKLYGKVNKEDWTGQRLDVSTWSDETGFLSQTVTLLHFLIGLLVTVLELMITGGVMSTMWIAIRERTREIGTLRAIGMQRRRVMAMFLAEAFVLGLSASTAGALAAVATARALNAARLAAPEAVQWILMSDHLTLSLQPTTLVATVLGLAALTTAAAVIPSLRAARLAPVTAMHHVG